MQKLRDLLISHSSWANLEAYVDRIEAHIELNFSISVENAKSLLESIAKEICSRNSVALSETISFDGLLKKAFLSIGYMGPDAASRISRALANIAQQLGQLRNEIGVTSHGRTLDEIKECNNKVDFLTKELLVETTASVACFLIRAFEVEPPAQVAVLSRGSAERDSEFDDYWDETYGEFEMGAYSYPASEILFNVDPKAYASEQKTFIEPLDNEQWKN